MSEFSEGEVWSFPELGLSGIGGVCRRLERVVDEIGGGTVPVPEGVKGVLTSSEGFGLELFLEVVATVVIVGPPAIVEATVELSG